MKLKYRQKLKAGIFEGIKKGWSGYLWILKILVPISLFTVLLEHFGVIRQLDFVLHPAMGLLGLPPQAALPLVIGILTGIYGAIAALVALPLTEPQVTLVAIFVLISHNLIQESAIQAKSGLNAFKATCFRLGASVITVLIAGKFLNVRSVESLSEPAIRLSILTFSERMMQWGAATLSVGIQILIIIMSLMIVLQLMRSFNLVDYLVKMIMPITRLMGLERETALIWLTASLFGISYGAAVIVEEAKQGGISKKSLEKLHLSIGINHAMVEDPALFLPLGVSAFWLWIPRVITAIVATRLLELWCRFQGLGKREIH